MRARIGLLAASALLVACTAVTGRPAEDCDGTWRGVESVIAVRGDGEAEPLAVTCMREIDEKRIRIGFTMPPGPSCYVLEAVQVAESADAVSVRLMVRLDDNPASGACPDNPGPLTTEVDLQAPRQA